MSAQELFDLTDKVAIITGGAGGIGIVYAEALCEAGAAVVIADVNAQAADDAAASLVAKGYKAVGTVVDVRSPESTVAMADAAIAAFGGIDILINNAAIMSDLPPFGLANMPFDEWDRVISGVGRVHGLEVRTGNFDLAVGTASHELETTAGLEGAVAGPHRGREPELSRRAALESHADVLERHVGGRHSRATVLEHDLARERRRGQRAR
jgi:hypothetical protein